MYIGCVVPEMFLGKFRAFFEKKRKANPYYHQRMSDNNHSTDDDSARSKEEKQRLIELGEVVKGASTNSSRAPLILTEMPSNDNSMAVASTVMSQTKHKLLVSSFIIFTIAQGYMASVMPWGAGWRYFSWHPFLMTTGFVGMMGSAVVTKKLGGYTNTKVCTPSTFFHKCANLSF